MTKDQENTTPETRFEYTPGPWKFKLSAFDLQEVYAEGDISVVRCWADSSGEHAIFPSREEAIGNAKLVEAAPKFYKRAKEIVSGFNDRGGKRMTIYDTAIKEGLEKIIKQIES